jgi:hypothetical protein
VRLYLLAVSVLLASTTAGCFQKPAVDIIAVNNTSQPQTFEVSIYLGSDDNVSRFEIVNLSARSESNPASAKIAHYTAHQLYRVKAKWQDQETGAAHWFYGDNPTTIEIILERDNYFWVVAAS